MSAVRLRFVTVRLSLHQAQHPAASLKGQGGLCMCGSVTWWRNWQVLQQLTAFSVQAPVFSLEAGQGTTLVGCVCLCVAATGSCIHGRQSHPISDLVV
jgi:hypothetical protein